MRNVCSLGPLVVVVAGSVGLFGCGGSASSSAGGATADGGTTPPDTAPADDAGATDTGGVVADDGPSDAPPPAPDATPDTATPPAPGPWVKLFGDDGLQAAWDVAADSTNGAVVVGSFTGSIDLGAGWVTSPAPPDAGDSAYVARYDDRGNARWSKTYVTADDIALAHVAVDTKDAVVASGSFYGTQDVGGGPMVGPGRTARDFFVMKLHADGSFAWSQVVGRNAAIESLTVDASDRIGIVGYFKGTLKLPGCADLEGAVKTSDGYAAVLDASGKCVWSRIFKAAGPAAGDFDAAGNFYVAGRYDTTIDFGDGLRTSAGGMDIWLAKLDGAGKLAWTRSYGDAADQDVHGLAVDGDRATFYGQSSGTLDLGGGVAFTSAGPLDGYVATIALADGAARWCSSFHSTGQLGAQSVAIDAKGNTVVGGRFDGELQVPGLAPLVNHAPSKPYVDDDDGYVLVYDAAGKPVKDWSFGGGTKEGTTAAYSLDPHGLAVTADDHVYVAGYASGPVDLGTGSLVTRSMDAFLARFAR